MSNQLPQPIIDQIRLSVKIEVNKALDELLNKFDHLNGYSNPKKDEENLSAEEAANFLKIKLNTLYSKCEKKEIPYYRVGKRKLLINKQRLIDYLKRNKGF